MRLLVTGHDNLFGPWMMHILKSHGPWFAGRGSTIGLWDTERRVPIASSLFEGYNTASIMMHLATDGSKKWMTREYLWANFNYPFEQLGVSKIISPVEGSNLTCCSFIEHIGFTLEATLKGAAPEGDLLIYTMTKDQCRWLTLRDKNGQAESATAA